MSKRKWECECEECENDDPCVLIADTIGFYCDPERCPFDLDNIADWKEVERWHTP